MNKCDIISHCDCTGCGACYNSCPKHAISMLEGEEGFLYPSISEKLCVDCGICYKVCPQALTDKGKTPIQRAYYGFNKCKKLVTASSSGGIFVALAQYIIDKGGVVFGACFDFSSKELIHKSTDEVPLETLIKSKYVQSNIGNSYIAAKTELEKGRSVLFVGTPCQISGLKHFLGNKSFDNLLTCDFVCHGVPPMKLLKEHICYLGFDSINSIDFRKKVNRWVDRFRIVSNTGKVYEVPWRYDAYFYFFEYGLSQRSSCYNCDYMKGYRESDITLADFWGYKSIDESIYNKDGLSMIIAYSTKGIEAIEEVRNQMAEVHEMNSSYTDYAFKEDSKSLEKRNAFYGKYKESGYHKTVSSYKLTKQKANIKMIEDSIRSYIVGIKRKFKIRLK